MGQFCLDANIFITAWGIQYPKDIFPGLWEQLASAKEQIEIIKPVYDEIKPLEAGTIKEWLHEHGFTPVRLNKKEEEAALILEAEYEIDPLSS